LKTTRIEARFLDSAMKGRASFSPAKSARPTSVGCLKALALLGGVGVLCIAWLLIEPAIHAVGVWWQRENYVPTELEILSVNLRGRKNNAYGRVVMSDEKLSFNTSDFNELLMTNGMPLRTTKQLQGLRVPVWYHPEGRTWFFRNLRVLPAYANNHCPMEWRCWGTSRLFVAALSLACCWPGQDWTRLA
jgi:hypothetical protein